MKFAAPDVRCLKPTPESNAGEPENISLTTEPLVTGALLQKNRLQSGTCPKIFDTQKGEVTNEAY